MGRIFWRALLGGAAVFPPAGVGAPVSRSRLTIHLLPGVLLCMLVSAFASALQVVEVSK